MKTLSREDLAALLQNGFMVQHYHDDDRVAIRDKDGKLTEAEGFCPVPVFDWFCDVGYLTIVMGSYIDRPIYKWSNPSLVFFPEPTPPEILAIIDAHGEHLAAVHEEMFGDDGGMENFGDGDELASDFSQVYFAPLPRRIFLQWSN